MIPPCAKSLFTPQQLSDLVAECGQCPFGLCLDTFVIAESDFYEMLSVDQEVESAQTQSVTLVIAQ